MNEAIDSVTTTVSGGISHATPLILGIAGAMVLIGIGVAIVKKVNAGK